MVLLALHTCSHVEKITKPPPIFLREREFALLFSKKNHINLERLIGRSAHYLNVERLIGISAHIILEGQICVATDRSLLYIFDVEIVCSPIMLPFWNPQMHE